MFYGDLRAIEKSKYIYVHYHTNRIPTNRQAESKGSPLFPPNPYKGAVTPEGSRMTVSLKLQSDVSPAAYGTAIQCGESLPGA